MKLLLSLLLAPVLSLAAATGSVTLLDGTPVSGAVIKSLTDSVTTSASGTFVLGRTSGISPRSTKTIPVTSHLVVEHGRPRLSFAGMDIAGRARSSAIARQNLSNPGASFAARSTGTPDTLKVYWKGKRLTVLPVTSDTTVTFRIDTAWKDDAGIPWNPAITYGSIYDARDGQTYRTVTIGSQTWMAENLNHSGTGNLIGRCYTDSVTLCKKHGRLYSWAETMGIDTIFNKTRWSGNIPNQGICPSEWHIPTNGEWLKLTDTTVARAISGTSLKSTSKLWEGIPAQTWNEEKQAFDYFLRPGEGTDDYGFRGLPSGIYDTSDTFKSYNPPIAGIKFFIINSFTGWWSASESDSTFTKLTAMSSGYAIFFSGTAKKNNGYSLRCLKD